MIQYPLILSGEMSAIDTRHQAFFMQDMTIFLVQLIRTCITDLPAVDFVVDAQVLRFQTRIYFYTPAVVMIPATIRG
jgi:hypothetical protein